MSQRSSRPTAVPLPAPLPSGRSFPSEAAVKLDQQIKMWEGDLEARALVPALLCLLICKLHICLAMHTMASAIANTVYVWVRLAALIGAPCALMMRHLLSRCPAGQAGRAELAAAASGAQQSGQGGQREWV